MGRISELIEINNWLNETINDLRRENELLRQRQQYNVRYRLRQMPDEVPNKVCRECSSYPGVYYPSYHYLDGNHSNELDSNKALICPLCNAHIVLSAYDPEIIWNLKIRGLSYAEIGRLIGLSRERVRQLTNKYQLNKDQIKNLDIDKLIQMRQDDERREIQRGTRKRLTDKRTIRKQIEGAIEKMKIQKGEEPDEKVK